MRARRAVGARLGGANKSYRFRTKLGGNAQQLFPLSLSFQSIETLDREVDALELTLREPRRAS